MVSFLAQADTPWHYAAGEQSFSLSYVDDRFDRVWEGDTEAPISRVLQQNIWFGYTFGLTDKAMLSAKVGYTQSSWTKNDSSFSGLSDSTFSIKYQVLDEFIDESIASLSVKMSGIIKGTYERASKGYPHAPGNKSNGGEISLQVGKYLRSNTAIYLDIGYKKLIDDVPDDILFSTGLYYSINEKLGINGQYSFKYALSGTDIKDPNTGFDPDFFHHTKEHRQWLEVSINYTFIPANTINFGAAQVFEGRNSGKSWVWFIGYQYSIY